MQQPYDRKTYDVVLSYDCRVEEPFTQFIRRECARNELSFFLLDHIWVKEFLAKLRRGAVRVRVLIDMSSGTFTPGDLFYTVARAVKRRGGKVIDDPDRARIATDKARFHRVLARAGIPVPPTVIVRKDKLAAFRVTPRMRRLLGEPFVIKPGWGGGGDGVITDARSEADIQRSVEAFPSDAYLLQQRIVPGALGGRPAWFRIFHVFGEVLPCWWDPATSVYNMVSPQEVKQHRLRRLDAIVRKIARLSQMDFFSTEIAITAEGRHYVIDYLNDECDMRVKSYYVTGAPDAVVERIARLLVANALTFAKKEPFEDAFTLKEWYIQQRFADGRSPLL